MAAEKKDRVIKIILNKDGKPLVTHKIVNGQEVVALGGIADAMRRYAERKGWNLSRPIIRHETVLDE